MKLTILLLLCFATSAFAQRPTGTFTFGGPVAGPTGFATNSFKVELPDVPYTKGGGRGQIAIAYPQGQPVAVDVHLSGHGGQSFFPVEVGDKTDAANYVAGLLANNHIVVMVAWSSNGWFAAQVGHADGMTRLSGRPATVFRWIHDNIAIPNGVPMNLIGISGGSCQIAYALGFYGIGDITKAAFLISCMPFDEQWRGVSQDYNTSERAMMSKSIGVYTQTGPAFTKDTSWADFWNANSVSAGVSYNYQNTRIVIITGKRDSQDILTRADHYQGVLTANGQPIERYVVPTMSHPLNYDGFNLLYSLVTQ